MNSAIIGLQWGDEGKGKLVDFFANTHDIICRYQGGANAGHTVIYKDRKISLHLIPSGIFHADKICILGNGTVIDIEQLTKELDELKKFGIKFKERFFISKRAHIILPRHFKEENEIKKSLGTTGKGIGPAYSDKMKRTSIRIGDIFNDNYLKKQGLSSNLISKFRIFREKYGTFVKDSVQLLNEYSKRKKRILFEGAQGVLLDIDFGTYPYVTSSSTTTGGIFTGSGINPFSISRIIGVSKAYTTRVGSGPFPTEFKNKMQQRIREAGNEYGATTGRPRRCGWLDLVALKYSLKITGATELAITKIDVLDELNTIKVATKYRINNTTTDIFPSESWQLENAEPVYESFNGWDNTKKIKEFSKLNKETRNYIKFIEDYTGINIRIISTGMERGDLIRV